jgi:hypothetical protein
VWWAASEGPLPSAACYCAPCVEALYQNLTDDGAGKFPITKLSRDRTRCLFESHDGRSGVSLPQLADPRWTRWVPMHPIVVSEDQASEARADPWHAGSSSMAAPLALLPC